MSFVVRGSQWAGRPSQECLSSLYGTEAGSEERRSGVVCWVQ